MIDNTITRKFKINNGKKITINANNFPTIISHRFKGFEIKRVSIPLSLSPAIKSLLCSTATNAIGAAIGAYIADCFMF